MLERQTLYYGLKTINADSEFFYDAVDGMQSILPYSDRWETLLVQVSGGLDSALLLFLYAKSLKKIDSKVQILPLSLEIPSKAKSLTTARAVIKKVRDLTGYSHILPGLELIMPMEDTVPPRKDAFFNTAILKLYAEKKIQFEVNGNTKNPPWQVRHSFQNDDSRQLLRDNRTTVYNAITSASPHALVDKKGIIALYRKESLLDELAPLTLSCDMDIEEIRERNLQIPCGECWWCRERDWGFSSNNLTEKTFTS